MIWCPHCARKVRTSHHHTTCSVCCVDCGKVLFEETYTENAPFCRDAAERRSSSKINYDVLDTVFGDENRSRTVFNNNNGKTHRFVSLLKPKPMKSYAIGKEPVKEDDDYNQTQQESTSYDYDYDDDYDGGDENDNY